MPGSDPAALPSRPQSVGDWEDLLVRLELAPRALRNLLDGAAGRHAVEAPLRELLASEHFAVAALRALAAGGAMLPDAAAASAARGAECGVPAAVAEFERLRARNFAAVQRRGLEVWDWEATNPDGEAFTTYQLLSALARHDARAIAAIREVLRTGAGSC